MDVKHFGLKSRPFSSKAKGTAVFAGPQQSKMIASLQKGLGAADAVVTVTGPVGVGKSTLVDRALETLPTGRTAAHIGRMHLTQEEVIDLLMGGFGIKKAASGAIRRFAAFKRILQQQRDNGIPVAIVIEDAQKLGLDALAEVEALTAADNGDTASANIILMGQPGLHELLKTPELARLKQRVRLRLNAEPLTRAEVRGYLKHAFREAGGDYDTIFADNVTDIVFDCSEGIPRVINTLCESAMTVAVEEHTAQISAALISQVASDAFGYTTEPESGISLPSEASVAEEDEDIDWEEPARPKPANTQEVSNVVAADPAIGRDIIVESGCYPVAETIESPQENETVHEPQCAGNDDKRNDTNAFRIPELIDDTQPELPNLNSLNIDDPDNLPVLDTQPDVPGNTENEQFDLDAALSPEVESTNVMPGLTTNLDAHGQDKTEPTVIQEIIEPIAAITAEPDAGNAHAEPEIAAELDLPTLSDSMRVDVRKEAEHAKETAVTTPVAASPQPEQLPEIIAATQPEPVEEVTPDPEPEPLPQPAAELLPDLEFEQPSEPQIEQEADSVIESADVVADLAPAADPAAMAAVIPEFEAESLLATVDNSEPVHEPEKAHVVAADPLTESDPETESMAPLAAVPEPLPETPLDTSALDAETRESDVDALEAALQAAKNGELAVQKEAQKLPASNGTATEPQAENVPGELPEITLDKVISEQQLQLQKLDQFRDEMDQINSLEDVSDAMAETLFGVEFEAIAAAAIASPTPPGDREDPVIDAAMSPVALADKDIPASVSDAPELHLDQVEDAAYTPPKISTSADVNLDGSAALRIDMLNEMKLKAAAMAENVEMGSDEQSDNIPASDGPQPEPIENQINTSMTQTLEALNLAKMAQADAEAKEEKKSGGLFSRFRKSS